MLRDIGFGHPRNKTGEGGKRIFADRIGFETVMADFHKQDVVLDAKYKNYTDWNSITREDRFQLLAYMHVYNANKSGFLVPVRKEAGKNSTRNLNGRGVLMSIIGMNVAPTCNSFKEFCSYMEQEEQLLKEKIDQFCC